MIFRLDEEDDPGLWLAALRYILRGWQPEVGHILEIGRCSHWLRPHQTRWRADGGFAWPAGYADGTGFSRNGLPEFDWSTRLSWDGANWVFPYHFKHLGGRRPELRIAIPSRTRRHRQAAIHTLRHTGGDWLRVFFGFRHKQDGWVCTADSSINGERRREKKENARKPRSHRQRTNGVQ